MAKLIRRYEYLYYIGGENLKLHRKRVGLSQQQMAEGLIELGVYTIGSQTTDRRRLSELEKSFEFPVDGPTYQAMKKVLKI